MKVLITNCVLDQPSGTEIVVRDLALGLQRRGIQVSVYTPRAGELAKSTRKAGVTVEDDLTRIAPPDVIHGQHILPTIMALLRFPGVPALYVCHDAVAPADFPPAFPRIVRHVAVDAACRDRMAALGIPAEQIRLLFNPVDLRRFTVRSPLPGRPRRALVFSNYVSKGSAYLKMVRAACREKGMGLDSIGKSVGRLVYAPETILGKYDVVFAKARCALESMAVGCAVVVADPTGIGGMVTPANFSSWRELNFGRRVVAGELSREAFAAALEQYDPASACQVCEMARSEASLDAAISGWITQYEETLQAAAGRTFDPAQEMILAAGYLREWSWDARCAWEREQVRKLRSIPFLGARLESAARRMLSQLTRRASAS